MSFIALLFLNPNQNHTLHLITMEMPLIYTNMLAFVALTFIYIYIYLFYLFFFKVGSVPSMEPNTGLELMIWKIET